MSGAKGAIGDGNYKVVSTRKIVNKGLSNSLSCREMKLKKAGSNINEIDNKADLGNNGYQKEIRKQIITFSNTENNQNDINGQPNFQVTLNNSRLRDSKKSGNNSLQKNDSLRSGNISLRIKENLEGENTNINQQMMSGKLVFNSVLKTDNSVHLSKSPSANQGLNKSNSAIRDFERREYEMRIKTKEDLNRIQNKESKSSTGINLRKNSKTKNVEQLRDYDSQKSF